LKKSSKRINQKGTAQMKMPIVVGATVQHIVSPEYIGKVIAIDSLVYCGKRIYVAVVKWDGKHQMVPMQAKDESGTGRKHGYRLDELRVIK
jgi:hypothetical protein